MDKDNEYIAQLKKCVQRQLQSEFQTYKQAIEEIMLLKSNVSKLERELKIFKKKKPLGRPRKKLTGLARVSSILLEFPLNTKKALGRPQKTSKEEMTRMIKMWDEERHVIAQKLGKKSVTDATAICHMLGKPKLQHDMKQRKFYEKSIKLIGYYRDQTGIKTRKNKLKIT